MEQRSYDLAEQLTQLNRVGIGKLDYAYDLSGNITQIGTERYSYDSLDRLLQAQGAAPRRYSYDANGNRTASDASPYVLAVDSNRLLQGSARVYDYDAAGNPLSDGRYSYTYDSPGRFTEVRQGAAPLVRSNYNALGQRVRKDAARSTHYLYSTDGQLLAELDASGNTLREYLYLHSWPVAVVDYAAPPVAAAVAVVEGADSIEESVEVADAAPKDAETRADLPVVAVPGATLTYLHPDHLGTPRLATDSSKRVIWRWDSAPFGDSPAQEDPDGDGVRFTLNLRFPGQYFDAETGLHYNYFRDYDPVTGRYLESDPIGLRGGVNTYGYVDGNPLIKIDLFGLFSVSPKCSSGQAAEIRRAEIELRKRLFESRCGDCDDGDSGCVPCEYLDALRRAFDRVTVICGRVAGSPACGITVDTGNRDVGDIVLTNLAFTHQMPLDECGCLESILYHELFHTPEVGLNYSKHPIIERFVLRCFTCARWHDPNDPRYPSYKP